MNSSRCTFVARRSLLGAAVIAASTASADSLEEVVVTASRVEQALFTNAASLSVLTAQDLDRKVMPTVAELMRDLPGVQISDGGQPGLARVRIRGEESRRTAILVDGQLISDHYEVGTPLTLPPELLQRIEVVRGSGAIMYGSKALSGVVNFITRKGGTAPVQGEVSYSYLGATDGEDKFYSLYGNLDGWEYRVAYSDNDHSDRRSPHGRVTPSSFNSEDSYLYLGKSMGQHRFEYVYEDYDSSSKIYVEDAVRFAFPFTDFRLNTPRRDRRKHALFYDWEVSSSWLDTVEASAFYQRSNRDFISESDTVWFQRNTRSVSELDTTGALVQLNLRSWYDHHVQAGMQYTEDKVDQSRHTVTQALTPIFFDSDETLSDKARQKTVAWFAQDIWSPAQSSFSVTAGFRAYHVSSDLNHSDHSVLSGADLKDDDKVVGALAGVWELNTSAVVRLGISEGYVYPALTQLVTGAYAGPDYVNPNPDLKPETSLNYEAGLRLRDAGWVVDATAFYSKSKDYIDHLSCTALDPCLNESERLYQNVGKSHAHGVELYVAAENTGASFTPYATVTWMKRRNEYNKSFSTWDSGVPHWRGRMGLRWDAGVVAGFSLWADAFVRGESQSAVEEPDTVRSEIDDKRGWGTLNLSAGVGFGRRQQHSLTLELLNLGDKYYVAATENLPGVERSASVRLKLSF